MKEKESGKIIPIGTIQQRILEIRGIKTIVDADLAKFYGVETKRLNEQVKRNPERFPDDFMFQLTKDEKAELVAKCDHLPSIKFTICIHRTAPRYFCASCYSLLI